MTPMQSLRSSSAVNDEEHDQIAGCFGQYKFTRDLPISTGVVRRSHILMNWAKCLKSTRYKAVSFVIAQPSRKNSLKEEKNHVIIG